MKDKIDIYKDFKGYNAYPLREAEKIIRNRILEEFSKLTEMVGGCVNKAKEMQMIWILGHIMAVKVRMERMQKQIKDRDTLFVPANLKEKISRLDEDKLKAVDFRLVELIQLNKKIIDSLSCAETDTHIIDKFTEVNKNLRDMEENCHVRSLLLKKEII